MEATPAADLLQWLDANCETQVMDHVQSSLAASDGSTVPVAVEVDLMSLVCDDVELATNVMQNTRSITSQCQFMINQQLTMHVTTTEAEAQDPDAEPRRIRLHLQFTDAPLPLSTPQEVHQQALSDRSCPTAPSQGVLVSCLGVVVGVSPPIEKTYSCRMQCPSCGSTVDVMADKGYLPCCNLPITNVMQEDLTGRVMMPSQQLWVSNLSSASGQSSYGCSSATLLVHVPEHQVATCSLGAAVGVIGHVRTHVTAATTATATPSCSIQIHASNVQQMHPHMCWLKPPSTSSSSSTADHHLQHLWDLLSTALGCQSPIDPHVAMSMLLSAAAVGGRGKQQTGTAEQVNVLFLHDSFSPLTLRLLQTAANLLSPQSVFMPTQLAEHINPITKDTGSSGTEDSMQKPVFASILHLANAGVAVADLDTLPIKSKQQLMTVLQQRATPPQKDLLPNMHPPMTATCWASAAWQSVSPANGDEVSLRPAKQSAAAAKMTYNGFDLCIGDGTSHEDELFWMLDRSEGTAAQQLQIQKSEQQAADTLRQLIAAAAMNKPPVLSGAAQTFLGQYFLVLRQSLESSNKVSKPTLLASLVRIATAVARLHQRNVVDEQPDAALAVVLMEQTLTNKLGDAYRSLLELPANLHPSNGRTLDDQIGLLHGIMSRTFRQYCCTEDEQMVDGDDDSGCGGGPGAGGAGLPDSQVEVGF